MRPLIGVSSYREQARWGSWDVPCVLLPATYVDAIAAAGGEPVLLPTSAVTADVVGRLDGLVIAGGADVDPGRYGELPGPHTVGMRPDRDATEALLIEAALAADLPLLAVCRGMQLLNVVLGGSLVQHVPDLPGARSHDPGPGAYEPHTVAVTRGSQLYSLLGGTDANCHHHQALDRLGRDLAVSARAQDVVAEAVERGGARYCVGVQWHPETGSDRRLFTALVQAASAPAQLSRAL